MKPATDNPVTFPSLNEEDMTPKPNHNENMFKAWEELGFMRARLATYEFMKANPDAYYTDVLDHVNPKK